MPSSRASPSSCVCSAPRPATTSRQPASARPDLAHARSAVAVSFSASRRCATSTTGSVMWAHRCVRDRVRDDLDRASHGVGHEPADGHLGREARCDVPGRRTAQHRRTPPPREVARRDDRPTTRRQHGQQLGVGHVGVDHVGVGAPDPRPGPRARPGGVVHARRCRRTPRPSALDRHRGRRPRGPPAPGPAPRR